MYNTTPKPLYTYGVHDCTAMGARPYSNGCTDCSLYISQKHNKLSMVEREHPEAYVNIDLKGYSTHNFSEKTQNIIEIHAEF